MSMIIRKRMKSEGGFTLVELLVVIIIIGILAAIAIPMYLNQRTKGWQASDKSDLRNAAIAMESYYTDNATYVGATEALLAADEGFNPTTNVTLTVDTATANGYCLEAVHSSGGGTWSMDEGGNPTEAACP